MRILLLRHGEPDYARDSLTPAGRKEADLLGRRMASYQLRDVYVSPLGRARETAEYTLSRIGRGAETLPWLAEFRGSFRDPESGKNRIPWDLPPRVWTSIPQLSDPDGWADAELFAGGTVRRIWDETRAGVDALMGRYGFRREGGIWLANRNARETIALFCHFGISIAVLAYLMNLSPVPLWHRTLCLPSSLTEVVTEERVPGEVSFRLTRLGDIAHLTAAGMRVSSFGLFPECYTGKDSTDPAVNGEPAWEP